MNDYRQNDCRTVVCGQNAHRGKMPKDKMTVDEMTIDKMIVG